MSTIDIFELYKKFLVAGGKSYRKGTEEGERNLREYRTAREELFSSLKEAHKQKIIQSGRADEIIAAMEEAKKNPLAFFGSEKTANYNLHVFLQDRKDRLFECLLNAWIAAKGERT